MYVYPDRSYSIKPDTNPYIKDLVKALEETEVSVVRSKTAWLGVIDIFRYAHRLDAVVFNWVEEVANRTMGHVQAIALIFLIPFLKLSGVKVIWTIHNKVSHSPKNRRIAAYFRKLLMKQADVRIAHTGDVQLPGARSIVYYPHPFKQNESTFPTSADSEYDVLVWGSILPYKGIKEFLEAVHARGDNNLRIHIQGKCPDSTYYQALMSLVTDRITICNKFTSDEELKTLMHASRTVVFTYQSQSVLSSGALIESIANFKTVIGPDFGNFKDCRQEGIAYTFSDFNDLIDSVYAIKEGRLPLIDPNDIEKYIRSYSWLDYAYYLRQQVENENVDNLYQSRQQLGQSNQLA